MDRSKQLKVAVIGGDGTGPEVAAEGVKVLQAVCSSEGIALELKDFDYGGNRYLRSGEILPGGALEELGRFGAECFTASDTNAMPWMTRCKLQRVTQGIRRLLN